MPRQSRRLRGLGPECGTGLVPPSSPGTEPLVSCAFATEIPAALLSVLTAGGTYSSDATRHVTLVSDLVIPKGKQVSVCNVRFSSTRMTMKIVVSGAKTALAMCGGGVSGGALVLGAGANAVLMGGVVLSIDPADTTTPSLLSVESGATASLASATLLGPSLAPTIRCASGGRTHLVDCQVGFRRNAACICDPASALVATRTSFNQLSAGAAALCGPPGLLGPALRPWEGTRLAAWLAGALGEENPFRSPAEPGVAFLVFEGAAMDLSARCVIGTGPDLDAAVLASNSVVSLTDSSILVTPADVEGGRPCAARRSPGIGVAAVEGASVLVRDTSTISSFATGIWAHGGRGRPSSVRVSNSGIFSCVSGVTAVHESTVLLTDADIESEGAPLATSRNAHVALQGDRTAPVPASSTPDGVSGDFHSPCCSPSIPSSKRSRREPSVMPLDRGAAYPSGASSLPACP